MCHCLNRAGAYIGFLRSVFNPRLRADSRTHKSVAADGSQRTFSQLLRSAPTPVGGYDFLNPPCGCGAGGKWPLRGSTPRPLPRMPQVSADQSVSTFS